MAWIIDCPNSPPSALPRRGPFASRPRSKCLSVDPKDPRTYVLRGLCQHGLKGEAKARADYEKAIELAPKSAAGYYYLGMSYRDTRKRLMASQALEKAVELDKGGDIGKKAKIEFDKLPAK